MIAVKTAGKTERHFRERSTEMPDNEGKITETTREIQMVQKNAGETDDTSRLRESLRIQKTEFIRAQMQRQREAEDAILEQMLKEQEVIDRLNGDINANLDRTKESRKFNEELKEKINFQIYEMNGITEDKLTGIREYKNAYYQGCAFSLFLLSVVTVAICGILHGFDSQICLFMIACTGVEGALLAQDKWRNKLLRALCKLLYLLVFPMMMVIFVCFELKYPEYELFLPYFAMGAVVLLIIGTAAFFLYDPYRQDKKRVRIAKDYISDVEKIAQKEVKKNQKIRVKEEKKFLKQQQKEEKQNQKAIEKETRDRQAAQEKEEAEKSKAEARLKKAQEREEKRQKRKENRQIWFTNLKEKWKAWVEKVKEKWHAFWKKFKKEE